METPIPKTQVTTVNFHLVKHCQMACNFCYARFDDVVRDTGVRSMGLPNDKAKKVIEELARLGFKKVNFAGGEPLLRRDMPELIRFAKSLGFVTSIISNGQLINESWVSSVHSYLDQIGISVDSAIADRRVQMGRAINGKPLSNQDYYDRAMWIKNANISFKINSVVTALNSDEDMNAFICELSPRRWKVFQALQIDGQNDLNANSIRCSDEAFAAFKQRHSSLCRETINTIFESNMDMISSYIMVDPYGRFFDNVKGAHSYSEAIWVVGGERALNQVNVDEEKFKARGGIYKI